MQNLTCPKCGSSNVTSADNGRLICANCGTLFNSSDEQTVVANPATAGASANPVNPVSPAKPVKKGFNWKTFGMIAAPILAIAGIGAGLFFMFASVRTDHFAAIPTDAPVVVKMNVGEVLKKSEISEIKEFQEELESSIDDEIEEEKIKELCKEVIKNPKKSGFDVMSPVAIAVTDMDNPQMLFVAPIDSRKKLEENLELLIDTYDDADLTLDKQDDYTVIKAGHSKDVSIAFNDKRFVFVGAVNGKAKNASRFVTQEKDKSILSQDTYKDFVDSKDDVACFVNCDPLADFIKHNADDANFDTKLMKGTSYCISLNFEKGKAVLKSKVNPGDKMRQICEKTYAQPDRDLLNNVPKNAFAVAQMGIGDLKPYFRALKKVLPASDRNGFMREINRETGKNLEFDDLAELLTGSVAAYAVLTDDVPDFGVVVKGKEDLFDIVKVFCDKQIRDDEEYSYYFDSNYRSIVRNGDVYTFNPNSSTPCYLTIDGKLLTFTNKKNGVGTSYNGQPGEEFIKNGGFYVDLEKLWNNSEIKKALKEEAGLSAFAKTFKCFHCSMTEGGLESEVVLEFADGDKNALAQIVKASFDFYKAQEKDRKNRRNDDEDDWNYEAVDSAVPAYDDNYYGYDSQYAYADTVAW